MPDGDYFVSLFQYISLNGFPQVPACVKLHTALGPCDKSLSDVTNQCVAFLSKHRGCPAPDFTFDSNYSAFLALSWLIAKYDLTEVMLETAVSSVESDSEKSTSSAAVESEDVVKLGPKLTCNRIAWTLGRLRLVLKNLAAQRQCEAQLMHKVHERTSGLSLSAHANHLTVSQINNLTCPGDIVKFQSRIQQARQVISSYLTWKAEEPSFWAWTQSLMSRTGPPDDLRGFVSTIRRSFSGPSLYVCPPVPIYHSGTDVDLPKLTARIGQQIRSAELETERVRQRTKQGLTEIGFSYEKACFMPCGK